MKTSFYTYSYIDRLTMEPDEVIPRVAAAGYDALDLSATWRDDEDPARFPPARRHEIRDLATGHQLSIEALVTHLPMVQALKTGRPINLAGAVDLAVELGAPLVTVHLGSPEAVTGREDRELAVDYLRRCCDYAGRWGVRIATDAVWPDTLTPTPESVLQLIQEVGSPYLGHNFDPCYLALCSFDVRAAARLLGPHLLHAHIKDHVGAYPSWEHRIPGEGELNHGEWAEALRETGFGGAVAAECFTDMPLDRALEVGYTALRTAIG